jgi:hypothetical protein
MIKAVRGMRDISSKGQADRASAGASRAWRNGNRPGGKGLTYVLGIRQVKRRADDNPRRLDE